ASTPAGQRGRRDRRLLCPGPAGAAHRRRRPSFGPPHQDRGVDKGPLPHGAVGPGPERPACSGGPDHGDPTAWATARVAGTGTPLRPSPAAVSVAGTPRGGATALARGVLGVFSERTGLASASGTGVVG